MFSIYKTNKFRSLECDIPCIVETPNVVPLDKTLFLDIESNNQPHNSELNNEPNDGWVILERYTRNTFFTIIAIFIGFIIIYEIV